MGATCEHGNVGYCYACGDYASAVIATRADRPSISEQDVVMLVSKVQALEAEVAALKTSLASLDSRYVRARVVRVCPCCHARILMVPEKANQDRLTCGNCNNSLPRNAWGET